MKKKLRSMTLIELEKVIKKLLKKTEQNKIEWLKKSDQYNEFECYIDKARIFVNKYTFSIETEELSAYYYVVRGTSNGNEDLNNLISYIENHLELLEQNPILGIEEFNLFVKALDRL
ncbi:hypothetical protein M0R19_05720 [Candidatus Pacearchaeota archaeon]|nr:hypothetical protein [Candidatus Pacearchaeota archaeon]